MSTRPIERRTFLGLFAAAFTPLTSVSSRPHGSVGTVEHPEPRPGITGAKVLKAEQLKDRSLVELFDGIRAFPHLADGIRCSCGCATLPDHRSLLSCYEEPAMATMCEVCKAQGELVVKRGREGQTLEQIRVAVNARWYRNERTEEKWW